MGSKEKYRNQSEDDQQDRASKDQPQLKSIFRGSCRQIKRRFHHVWVLLLKSIAAICTQASSLQLVLFSTLCCQMRLKPLKKGDKRCTWWQQIPPTISIRTKFGWSKRKKYNWNKTVCANIEHQLQTMGADIKQLCSEFVHDVMPLFSPDFMEGVAPELSPRQSKNVNLTTHESSMIGVDIDPKKGLCNKNSSAHRYCMEPVEEKHNDLLSNKKDNIGMSEKLNVSVMKNDTAKKPFPTEIPVVVDTAEKDSSLASLFCGVNKSDDERWDGQEDLSTPVSLDGYHSCMKEGETTNHVNATDD